MTTEHLELTEVAKMMAEDFPAKVCRHLGESCQVCGERLRQVAAAVTALEKGTGDETVARDVWDLLSRVVVLREP